VQVSDFLTERVHRGKFTPAGGEQEPRQARDLAFRYVLDLAALDGYQADQVVGLILPKFVEHSGLDASLFRQSCWRCIALRRSVWRRGIERRCQVCSGRR
jgi:hypothetical protein